MTTDPTHEPRAHPGDRYRRFLEFRSRLNQRILGDADSIGTHADGHARTAGTTTTRRFFALDDAAYRDGALDARTKELIGLAASMVLRCDDCIAYHVDRCVSLGATDAELFEVFDVALIVGGSIVIPHLRRAVDFLDDLHAARSESG